LGLPAVGLADLVVVPALAVDRAGVRLGRGGGSYDRALARTRPDALLVALLYQGELVDALPTEPHDARVDVAILPETGIARLPTSQPA
jgi:5-formyltetrahydrofolate cyclo-ligase